MLVLTIPATYPVTPFLGKTMPVTLAAELTSVALEDQKVSLHCATKHYTPEVADYYGTLCETILSPVTDGHPIDIHLEFYDDAIIRMRAAPMGQPLAPPTPMVVGQFSGPKTLHVFEEASCVIIETERVRIEIVREPVRMRIFDKTGRLLWSTRPLELECMRRPETQWNPSENRWLFFHRYAYPLGFADYGADRYAFLSTDLRYDEHIYGLGEDYGRLDKRQTQRRLWNVEAFSNASPGAYKNIPFFMSTAGYGLFIHTSHAATVHIGNREHTALSLLVEDTTELDLFWIYGPTLKEILPRYTAITGAPGLPPKWSFGLWMGRISYNRQEQVEQVAADLRNHRIPCDVIHIDTDWYEHDWQCDLEFGKSKFPDPAGMIARLRAQGFRVCLWQWPNLTVNTTLFVEGRERGYLAKRSNGHPYLFPGFAGDAGFIDYSNPEAVAWIQEKFRKLFDLGVAAIKVDFGEGASPEAHYCTVPSEAMHNLYALLYNRALFEVTEAYYGKGKAVIWARSAWAGSQRYPLHWSGDGLARFEDLACVLRAALSFGLSGFPFYSHDIGGFSGLPDPALYVRWAQFGLFSSHARCHGVPPREPWAYGEEAEAIFRRYAELRYRLLPYIYSEAVVCTQSSAPFLRPLVLDWQDDPTSLTIDDQYLFGRSLLIAPILDESNRRRVYLPAGEWFDYWNKKRMTGGRWIEIEAPLDVLPIYVKAGAILPYGPLMQHSEEKPLDPLTLEFYAPERSGKYIIYDEDRPSISVQYCQPHDGQLHIYVDPAPGQVEIHCYGLEIDSAYLNGEEIPVESIEGGERMVFDGRRKNELRLNINR